MTTRAAARKVTEIKEAYEMGIIHTWEVKDQIAEVAEEAGMSYDELLSETAS